MKSGLNTTTQINELFESRESQCLCVCVWCDEDLHLYPVTALSLSELQVRKQYTLAQKHLLHANGKDSWSSATNVKGKQLKCKATQHQSSLKICEKGKKKVL